MDIQLLELFESTPYLISLIAGILTFLSPCVLPLVPIYLSYITGKSAKQLSDTNENGLISQLKIIKEALLFIFGFSLIFIILGMAMAGIMKNIFQYSWIIYLSSFIIISFGLHFIGILKLKFLYYEKRVNINIQDNKQAKGFFQKILSSLYPFILGIAFALGWTPCVGPILASIISLSATDANFGMTLMVIYSLGLGIPFLISAMLTKYFISFFNTFKNHLRKVEIISGILLVIIGIMMITGKLDDISYMLVQWSD
jgi:cytochrome c-type biogenesis protein